MRNRASLLVGSVVVSENLYCTVLSGAVAHCPTIEVLQAWDGFKCTKGVLVHTRCAPWGTSCLPGQWNRRIFFEILRCPRFPGDVCTLISRNSWCVYKLAESEHPWIRICHVNVHCPGLPLHKVARLAAYSRRAAVFQSLTVRTWVTSSTYLPYQKLPIHTHFFVIRVEEWHIPGKTASKRVRYQLQTRIIEGLSTRHQTVLATFVVFRKPQAASRYYSDLVDTWAALYELVHNHSKMACVL